MPDIAPQDRLILALDVPVIGDARKIVRQTEAAVSFYKIGHELLFGGGLELARELKAEGKSIFLDTKLLDISNTVEKSVANVARLGCDLLTIHGIDGKTLKAAVAGRGSSTLKLLSVTVMTHLDAADLREQGIAESPADLAVRRARMAQDAGFDGVIASGEEVTRIRAAMGPGFLIVTPGIRPAGDAKGDQTRVMTPEAALTAGADHLVVGRPITAAADPLAAARAIQAEIAAVSAASG